MKRYPFKINLQLFAAVNTTASGAVNDGDVTDGIKDWGGSGMSPGNKTYYNDLLIDEAGAELVHDQFGQKKDIPKNNGKTVEFRKYEDLSDDVEARVLTEGETPQGQAMNMKTLEATVKQYGGFIPLTDMLDLTNIDPVIVEATKKCGRQAGVVADKVVRNKINQGTTNVVFAPKVSAEGTETDVTGRSGLDITARLTVDLVEQIVAGLRANNAPTFGGDYVAIIHPYAAYDLRRDKDWREAHSYGKPEELFNGEIGNIAGVRFVQTSNAKIWKDNTCPQISSGSYYSVFSTLFLGEGAYGDTEITGGGLRTIIKQLGSSGAADPLDQRATVGWKLTKTAAVLIPKYIFRVESMSKFSKTAAAN